MRALTVAATGVYILAAACVLVGIGYVQTYRGNHDALARTR